MFAFAGKRRRPATLAAIGLSGIAAVAAVAALPASADHRPGTGVSVFHNLNFIAVGGYEDGEVITVDILREGRTIGSLTAAARAGDEGTGFEINHGVDTPPGPGDCWETHVPDVLPGDTVRVTDPLGAHSILVDDIQITRGMYLIGDDVAYEGVALRADGVTPIPLAELDSGEVRADGAPKRVRSAPTRVEAIPGVLGGWRAIHERSEGYGTFQNPADATPDEQRDALVEFGDPAMGYGHVVPPPPIVQLVEGLDEGGVALGCPDVPFERNSLDGADRDAINALNAGSPLVVNGSAASDVGDVEVSVNGTRVDDAEITVNTGARTWSATIPPSAIPADDGTVLIEADFPGSLHDTSVGARVTRLTLQKDTAAPAAPTANPAPGTHVGPRSVTLLGEAGATLRYTLGSAAAEPTASTGTVFTGPIPVTASQVIKAIAVDAAGNPSAVSTLSYTITDPQQQGSGGGAGAGAPQPSPAPASAPASTLAAAGAPVAGSSATPLSLGRLTVNKAITRRKARSQGIRLVMRLKEGTEVVRVRVYRKKRNGTRALLAEGFRAPSRSGLFRMRLSDRKLRRDLSPGSFEVDVTPGTSRTELGTTAKHAFRIVNDTRKRR